MKIGEKFNNFVKIAEEIYEFFGNRWEYAICTIDLGGWTPLLKFRYKPDR